MPSLAELINLWTTRPPSTDSSGASHPTPHQRVLPTCPPDRTMPRCLRGSTRYCHCARSTQRRGSSAGLRRYSPSVRMRSANRCRVGRWQRLAPSVYLTKRPATPPDLLRAAALRGCADCALSGAAALRALGLRSVRPATTELVLVPAASGVVSWGRIRVRRTARLRPPCGGGPGSLRLSAEAHDHLCSKRRLWRPGQS